MRRTKLAACLAALAAASLVTACGAGGSEAAAGSGPADGQPLVLRSETVADAKLMDAARKEGTFTLYDNYPEEQWKNVVESFTHDTGIKVNHLRLATPNLYQRFTAEKAGGKQSADVVEFGDPTLMDQLSKKGYLQPYKSPLRGALPPQFQNDDVYETYMQILMVPVYNTRVLQDSDAPTGWNQLLAGSAGKLGVTPITAGGSAFTVYNFLDTKAGPDGLRRLAAKKPRIYESVVPLGQDLIRGEISLAISDSGQTLQQIRQGAPLKPLYFPEGVPAIPNLSALASNAAHPNAAKVYENWLLSKAGGEAIVKGTSEYSVRADVPGPTADGIDLPRPGSKNMVFPTEEDWLKRRTPLMNKWTSLFKS
ncbi:extracellular solute-binding protein [Streptomyces sp. MI02-2A]|uniref:ABC transporter substrate-binding protein n=1 Tax=Streptomyces sp. MI02-2A TaxID=3028688 RepID=UPI0029BA55C5|nr:extracellular solute-binding protein [Streptomyces sp. MI02-2A]MDX3264989.1 extracellular solute-binding protein [Streptomyces sp. MI02-2A]